MDTSDDKQHASRHRERSAGTGNNPDDLIKSAPSSSDLEQSRAALLAAVASPSNSLSAEAAAASAVGPAETGVWFVCRWSVAALKLGKHAM